MIEDRPHRPARVPADAAANRSMRWTRVASRRPESRRGARGGRPGESPRRGVPRPAGLTERAVDVLRLLARGLANKQVAAKLGISAKTVGHHIEHIYTKADVTTRAGATLFARTRTAFPLTTRRWGEHSTVRGRVAVETLARTRARRSAMPTIEIKSAPRCTTSGPDTGRQSCSCTVCAAMPKVWVDQARRFSDRYTCVRYDRRGHLGSARGTTRSATRCTPTTPPRGSSARSRAVPDRGLERRGCDRCRRRVLRYGHLLRGQCSVSRRCSASTVRLVRLS